jgi:outer membrane biosynthesis protein TonB
MSQGRAIRTTRNRISAASLAGDRRSPLGWIGSVVLHGAVLVGTLFTVTHTLDVPDQAPPVVPIDLVTVAQKTNITPAVRPAPREQPEVTPPAPKPMPTPPTPPQQQASVAPEAPDTAPSEPVVAPEPAAAVPKLKPKPAPTPEKKNFDVDKVLALLNKVAPAESAAPNARAAQRTVKGFGAENAMTADLQDALRSQIQPCWSPPVGAPHPEQLIVSFDLFLNPDGSVAQPPQLTGNSQSAGAHDPYARAAKDAALRAIYTCAPYKLPADRYSQWREINPFIFDPRQMMGQ